ncbi:MAG: hypothetical protein OIF51_15485 [Cellvibrionaceae bacterium]|nr:hypothetical protein [Cellvibrionaceae bacterium]
MNYDQWVVSDDGRSASHACGWSIRIEGNPANPSEVCPSSAPKDLDALEQARLLRHGLDAIAKAAKQGVKPSSAAVAAKKAAEQYASDPNRQRKPKLSLKKKS